MPKPVRLRPGEDFSFKPAKKGGPAQEKYPWDEWFDDKLHELEQSVGKKDKDVVIEVSEKKDYECSTDSLPSKLKAAARKRYKVCLISRVDCDKVKLVNSLIIRSRDMTPEERRAEDHLRLEEKQKLKAAAAKRKLAKDTEEEETVFSSPAKVTAASAAPVRDEEEDGSEEGTTTLLGYSVGDRVLTEEGVEGIITEIDGDDEDDALYVVSVSDENSFEYDYAGISALMRVESQKEAS